jgi:pimeloyl-ACP methyl ester carboxylesterase
MPYSLIDRPKEQLALLHHPSRANSKLAIFVHGFQGNYLSTWGSLPDLLKDGALQDTVFGSWDFLFLGYKTTSIDSFLDIADRIFTEWDAAAQGIGIYQRPYERYALIGHSLGTLGIRQALCASALQPSDFLSRLHAVILFGTPVNGSFLANFAFWQSVSDALKPASPQLRMLHEWTRGAAVHAKWPPPRLVLGLEDAIVGSKYGRLIAWEGDRTPQRVQLGHSEMVKPDDWHATAIAYLREDLA